MEVSPAAVSGCVSTPVLEAFAAKVSEVEAEFQIALERIRNKGGIPVVCGVLARRGVVLNGCPELLL